jgi:chromosome segregation ATPase
MTGSRGSAAGDSRGQGPQSVAERSHQIERERAIVEEVISRLKADEQRLLSDSTALRAERNAIELELAEVRDRLATLDASLAVRKRGLVSKEREVAEAREQLVHQQELANEVEREISEHRSQIAIAQKRLGALVEDVVRVRHKLWRATSGESPREGNDGQREHKR